MKIEKLVSKIISKDWRKISSQDLRFVKGYLSRSDDRYFRKTIEGLTAIEAFNYLKKISRKDAIEYGVMEGDLDFLFFRLNEKELDLIRKNLPPYPLISYSYWNRVLKNMNEEEAKIMKTKIPRYKFFLPKYRKIKEQQEQILKKYGVEPTEEEIEIAEKRGEKDWIGLRKVMIPLYAATLLGIYTQTQNPLAVLTWLAIGPLPYRGLKMMTNKMPKRRIKKMLQGISKLYLISKSPLGFLEAQLEFGLGAPLVSKALEKTWSYSSRLVRKVLYKWRNWLSGRKLKKFDKKEIKEKIVEMKFEKFLPSLVEEFKSDLENDIIEIEDPGKTLLFPFAFGYHTRKIVVENNKIVDKDYVKKLAKVKGKFVKKLEKEILSKPWKYLMVDVKDGKVVYCRDVLGIPSYKKPEKLTDAISYKESYGCLLGREAQDILLTYSCCDDFQKKIDEQKILDEGIRKYLEKFKYLRFLSARRKYRL